MSEATTSHFASIASPAAEGAAAKPLPHPAGVESTSSRHSAPAKAPPSHSSDERDASRVNLLVAPAATLVDEVTVAPSTSSSFAATSSVCSSSPGATALSNRKRLRRSDTGDRIYGGGDDVGDGAGCSHTDGGGGGGVASFELASSRHCRQCGGGQCGRVVFNVSGLLFETQRRTLSRFPGTLLGSPRRLRPYWDDSRRQYCLSRHQATFQCILYYYQSGGRLYRDADIPEDVFMSELGFYELDVAVVKAFKLRNGFLPSLEPPPPPPRGSSKRRGGAGGCGGSEDRGVQLRRRVWLALEYPSTSWPAATFAVLSLLVTCLSLLCFSLESLPQFDEIACLHEYTTAALERDWTEEATVAAPNSSAIAGFFVVIDGGGSGGRCANGSSRDGGDFDSGGDYGAFAESSTDGGHNGSERAHGRRLRVVVSEKQNYAGPFFVLECCCVAWFTAEVVLRFATCDCRRRYFRSATNLFDLFAVLPFFIALAVVATTDTCDHSKSDSPMLILLRLLRLLRSARVFKLTKHSRGMHILGLTIVHSIQELTLFFLFTAIAVVFFASAAYYADEIDTGSASLRSIPEALWYVVITYCTVGYGDVVPRGPLAKTVGAACCACGVVTVGLLVPVVVTNFARFYNHELVERSRTHGRRARPSSSPSPQSLT